MSEAAYDYLAEPAAPAAPSAAAGHGMDLLAREAWKGGKLVLSLRCGRSGNGYVVDCEAYQAEAMLRVAPERRSYHFVDLQHAELFIHDAAQALEYLGCTVE